MQNEKVKATTIQDVIATNILCLKKLLETALIDVIQADQAMDEGQQNLAIGCLLEIEPAIQNAKALYDATMFMHRNGK